jgi:hypothetical protein
MKKVTYTYTSSVDYINGLEFDYIETYSLLRGKEFEESIKLMTAEYNSLKKIRYLNASEGKRFTKLEKLLNYTQYLINEESEFHPSSKKINTFEKNHPIIEKLKTILRTEIKEVPAWMCAPEYRDAIVFYDSKSQIVSCLNVCLSCEYMETKMFNHINADWETYDLLKRFFIDIGHDIENPDYFAWESLQKQFLNNQKNS